MQAEKESDDPYLCISDFIAPKTTGQVDYIGMFANSGALPPPPALLPCSALRSLPQARPDVRPRSHATTPPAAVRPLHPAYTIISQ